MTNQTPPKSSSSSVRVLILGLVIVTIGIGVTIATIYLTRDSLVLASKPGETQPSAKERLAVELVEDVPHTLRVPDRVRNALGIQDSIIVQPPAQGRPLIMPGSTALDPSRVMRVRTRFNADVVEITQAPDESQRTTKGQTIMRELRPGDRVRKGDVLAVVWSVDVGVRKSDLVDALVQLELDEKRLKSREKLFLDGSIP